MFIRKGNGVETSYFKEYTKLVQHPLADAVRKRKSMPLNADFSHILITRDGGGTQFLANLSEESIQMRGERNETYCKTAKNFIFVFQSADNGDGHMHQRVNLCKSDKQPAPNISCGLAFNCDYRDLSDEGMLNLKSTKLSEIRAVIVRYPKVIAKSYSQRSVIKGFIRAGQLDKETVQALNVYAIMGTLKRADTINEREQ